MTIADTAKYQGPRTRTMQGCNGCGQNKSAARTAREGGTLWDAPIASVNLEFTRQQLLKMGVTIAGGVLVGNVLSQFFK